MQRCCFISACSCAEDCGLTLSCCFESMDRHHLVAKEHLTCTEASFPTEANYISPDGVWTINTCPVRKIRMCCKCVSIVVLGNCFLQDSGDIISTENNQKQYCLHTFKRLRNTTTPYFLKYKRFRSVCKLSGYFTHCS